MGAMAALSRRLTALGVRAFMRTPLGRTDPSPAIQAKNRMLCATRRVTLTSALTSAPESANGGTKSGSRCQGEWPLSVR